MTMILMMTMINGIAGNDDDHVIILVAEDGNTGSAWVGYAVIVTVDIYYYDDSEQ